MTAHPYLRACMTGGWSSVTVFLVAVFSRIGKESGFRSATEAIETTGVMR